MSYLNSKARSEELAARIRAYYRKTGDEVKVWVEKEGSHYVVRSNIIFKIPTAPKA